MKQHSFGSPVSYKPILFTVGAFLITWVCIFALESTYLFAYEMPGLLAVFFDFTKSAAPLIVALILFGRKLTEKGFLVHYLLGERKGPLQYIVVALMFFLQFFIFFLFRPADFPLTAPMFLSVFAGQLLFGGGLEEGGWRGYLFPAFKEKMPVLLASTLTSIIWTLWHLPYFLIPTSSQYGSNFFAYLLITVLLGYLLSAVYLLTKSVLLCTLFHAFSNTVVMTMQADMGNMALLAVYAVFCIGGAALCQIVSAQEKKTGIVK